MHSDAATEMFSIDSPYHLCILGSTVLLLSKCCSVISAKPRTSYQSTNEHVVIVMQRGCRKTPHPVVPAHSFTTNAIHYTFLLETPKPTLYSAWVSSHFHLAFPCYKHFMDTQVLSVNWVENLRLTHWCQSHCISDLLRYSSHSVRLWNKVHQVAAVNLQ